MYQLLASSTTVFFMLDEREAAKDKIHAHGGVFLVSGRWIRKEGGADMRNMTPSCVSYTVWLVRRGG